MTSISVTSTDHWHQLRAKTVGGSEVAALFGESPYCTEFEFFHLKNGTLPPVDLDDNERVQAGRHIEPAIARWAAEKWDMRLRKVRRYITHPTVEGMGCSLDFESQEGALIPVEIKLVDYLVFRDQWECEGDTITDAPIHILLQKQHQLACTRATYGWIIVCVAGNQLKRMKVERRPKTIALIEQRVAAFWASIRENRPPKPDFTRDGDAISTLYGAADGDKVVDLTGDNRLPELCAEYRSAADAAKAAEDRKSAAKAEMLLKIGDAGRVLCGEYTIGAKQVAAADISYHREAYRAFRLTERKQKDQKA